ncbi:hypothetical protein [Lachnoclostridium sp. An76]|uniref:hypothetical protein n=1 Tax=Lachnoclostridium sp. An76 TaxID=1965654 RepID=UPI000B3801C4|nr:hypothetical protein [Lachnoclostridium sp. An76]OUN33268.1 hypothetical protein B5G27_12885 [Lachnoclostridium sp. An76]
MNEIKSVSPNVLYPMTTIASINPDTLQKVVYEIKNGVDMPLIQVIEFGGYYFIWNGNYEMIAANMVGKLQVDVEIIPLEQQNSWLSEEGIEEQLKTVGMNALYDFEALGGFKYPEYPVFYKGGK